MVVDEPLHAALEARQAIHDFRLERFHSEKRNKANYGANLQKMLASVGQAKDVVVEAIFVVPQSHAVDADVVHGVGDVNEMLKEFARDVFVGHVLFREFQRDGQHIQAVHAHPTGAVRLFKMSAGGKGCRTVENTDVVEAQEAPLENVGAVRIFAIDPPGEIEQLLVKDSFEKGAVGSAADAPLDFVNAPGGPGMHGRIYVAESPFVGGQLPVGMHIPFAEEKNELLLGEVRIYEGNRNAMEREVPGGVPGVLPLVRHGDDVLVVEVHPVFVAAAPALDGGLGPGRIAFKPVTNIVVIKLLGPE